MMKNVLVTGGNGQLGNSVRKVANKYPNYQFIFTDVPEVDITDLISLEKLIEEQKIDIIINCAAYTAVDKAESDEVLARKIKADGPKNLAIAANKSGAK